MLSGQTDHQRRFIPGHNLHNVVLATSSPGSNEDSLYVSNFSLSLERVESRKKSFAFYSFREEEMMKNKNAPENNCLKPIFHKEN